MSGFFYNLGRQLGRKTIPAVRKSKWIWDGLTGTEEESLRAEAALGRTMAVELRDLTGVLNDPPLQHMVNEICQRLAASVGDPHRTFYCEVICEPLPNAVSLPGGFIFLSDSLVALCQRNRDELAFIIAHEMAHVVRRHSWDRMLNEAALRVAGVVAARAGSMGIWLRQQGLELLRSAHAAEAEARADEMAFRLILAAGFAPAGTFALLQRIAESGGEPDKLGSYLGSHPPPSGRMARLKALGGEG